MIIDVFLLTTAWFCIITLMIRRRRKEKYTDSVIVPAIDSQLTLYEKHLINVRNEYNNYIKNNTI